MEAKLYVLGQVVCAISVSPSKKQEVGEVAEKLEPPRTAGKNVK